MLEPGNGTLASGENEGDQGLDFLIWANLISAEPMELSTQAMI